MSDKSLWDAVDEEGDASLSASSQFGQITIAANRYIHWVDSQAIDVSPEEFAKLPQNAKSLELLFAVNIREFRTDIDWTHERNIRIGDKNWRRTLVPSVVALMGKGSMSKGKFGETLEALSGRYVETRDVPKIGNEEFSTLEFVTLFANRDACYNAWAERFSVSNAEADASSPTVVQVSGNVPENYTTENWATMNSAIKKALSNGQSVLEVAKDYDVAVPFIAAIAAE